MESPKLETGVWSIRELTERTAEAIDQVTRTRVPVAIIRYGRLVATLQPVPENLEQLLLSGKPGSPILSGLGRTRDDGTADAIDASEALQAAEQQHPTVVEAPSELWTVGMSEFNQRTGEVVCRVREHQRNAVITRRGRIVAILAPLPTDLETQLLRLPQVRDFVFSFGAVRLD